MEPTLINQPQSPHSTFSLSVTLRACTGINIYQHCSEFEQQVEETMGLK
jgi:hypothetical protein